MFRIKQADGTMSQFSVIVPHVSLPISDGDEIEVEWRWGYTFTRIDEFIIYRMHQPVLYEGSAFYSKTGNLDSLHPPAPFQFAIGATTCRGEDVGGTFSQRGLRVTVGNETVEVQGGAVASVGSFTVVNGITQVTDTESGRALDWSATVFQIAIVQGRGRSEQQDAGPRDAVAGE